MAEPIFMRIGEGASVDLPELVGAITNFLGLLREVDSSVARKKSGNLRWRVTTLKNEPAPLVGVTPSVRKAINDTSEFVESQLIANLGSITERGERNEYLSDAALTRVEKIAKTAPKLGPSAIYSSTRGSLSLTTSVTSKTLDQVRDLTSVRSVSFGTITGNLDTISVHNGLEFRVWDSETNRPVRCYLDPKQRRQAMDLLGLPVVVMGMLKADRQGRPVSMMVESFDSASGPIYSLPTIEEMRGLIPDFTGGLSLKEFFEDTD